MFEKEIQFLNDFNLNKIKKLGSQFTFEKLLITDIHPAILQYISGELDYLVFEDRYRLLRNSDFDYSGSRIAEYFNLMAQEIKRTKKFSSDEAKRYIEKAIVFNVNYVTQPRMSLVKLIFRDNRNSKSVSEINIFFNFIFYYDYLKDIFGTYADKRKVVSINQRELELILRKIDDELFADKPEELINDALYSMADFYNHGGISKTLIPANLIEDYLKEKNLNDYIARLNKAFPDNKKKAEIDELKFVLFSKAFVVDTVEEIKESIQEKTKEEIKPAVDKFNKIEFEPLIGKSGDTGLKESEISSREEEEKIFRVHDFEEKQESKKTEPELKETKQATDDKKPERKSRYEEIEFEALDEYVQPKDFKSKKDTSHQQKIDGERKEMKDAVSPDKEVRRNMKDIFSFLSDKEIERIVSLVFNEDRDDFANTLEKLSESGSYDDATEILKSVFFTYRVNPYSKEAITLTNAVSNYFDQA